MTARATLSLCALSVFATVAACGGAASSPLFGAATGDDGGGGGGGPDATVGGGEEAGADGGGGGDDAAAEAAVEAATGDDGPAAEAATDSGGMGGDGGEPGIRCGNTTTGSLYCKFGTACCAKNVGGGSYTFRCSQTMDCPQGDIPITCDAPAECSSMVCCGELIMTSTTSGMYTKVSCQPDCNNAGVENVLFCDPDAGGTEYCAKTNQRCVASQSLPTFFVCQP